MSVIRVVLSLGSSSWQHKEYVCMLTTVCTPMNAYATFSKYIEFKVILEYYGFELHWSTYGLPRWLPNGKEYAC